MGAVVAIAAAAGLYLLLSHQNAGISFRGFGGRPPAAAPGVNFQASSIAPGAATDYGSSLDAQQGLGLAAQGIGLAVPVAGAIIGLGAGIFGAITAHHKQAVAKEGAGMGQAIPHWNQGLVLLIKAAASGAYGHQVPLDTAAMERDLRQLFQDYLRIVGGFLRGTPQVTAPHAVFNPANGSYKITPASGGPPQNPCNGPCSYAKAYFPPQMNQALQSMIWAARGIHASFQIPALPADPAKKFPGAAGVSVSW